MVAELAYMLKEILFLKALWEHNRRLWWFSFPFHVGLYLLVVAAAVLVLAGGAAAAGDPGARVGGDARRASRLAGVGLRAGRRGRAGTAGQPCRSNRGCGS